MVRADHRGPNRWLLWLVAFPSALTSGCAVVPRAQMDECQRLSQTLRSENARLKDQVLALQSQNRDYADRAVDDLRRLSARDQALERLEQSVQAYQEERERLGDAYEQLTTSLGRPTSPSGASRDSTLHQGGHRVDTPSTTSQARRPKGVTAVEDEEARP